MANETRFHCETNKTLYTKRVYSKLIKTIMNNSLKRGNIMDRQEVGLI